MKRTLSVMGSLLLAAGVLSGCAQSSADSSTASGNKASGQEKADSSKKQVTLKLFHRWPKEPEKTYFESVVKEFEKQNPNIKIQLESVLNDSYKEKIRVLLGTNEPPDIFFTWSGEFAYKFIRGQKALDLTPYLSRDQDWSNRLVASQVAPFALDGKTYGVPMTMDGKTFFYNKDIFKKLNLAVPKTWDELISVLDALKKNNYTPIAFGNKAPWAVSHYIGTLNQKMVDEKTLQKDYNRATGTFEDPAYVTALEKLNQLSGYFNKNVNSLEHQFARQMFIDGKAAIAYLQTAEIRLVEPNIKFELGFMDFPQPDGGKGNPNYMTGGPEGFMISSGTQHPEEAVAFLKFLTSKEMGEKLVKDVGFFSAVKGAVNSGNSTKAMQDAAAQIINAENTALWLDTALDSKIVDTYLNGVQLMLNGEGTPQDVIREVQKAAKAVREAASSGQ
ncbi:ABC transporter substrate-binding protein [Paenibacillus tyrfis]|uniref:ABC transporter substrate-binding protein n=1 Tax=Paenibacillus tyrfis TaxID=1501230 RepID=UPI00209E60E3|nr:extracellular solute-binding protein [Paenibacillus tyrfis]MCP1309083.1 extracellular solute-binding protein [Paenibacillus tyrfis]